MKRIATIAGTALVLALALTACGKDAATKETESAAATEAAERTVTGTLLRDSKEETAYLEASDTEIELWDSTNDSVPDHNDWDAVSYIIVFCKFIPQTGTGDIRSPRPPSSHRGRSGETRC